MKVVEVRTIFEFLSKLKLNKFTKEVRVLVLKNYTSFFTLIKEYDAKLEELRKKIFTDEDLQAIQNSVNNKTPLSKELIDKNLEYNEVITNLFKEECDVKIDKISEKDFIECLSESDIEFTPMDIINLRPILK